MKDSKACPGCLKTLPTFMFGKDVHSPDLLNPYCKICRNAARRFDHNPDRPASHIAALPYRIANTLLLKNLLQDNNHNTLQAISPDGTLTIQLKSSTTMVEGISASTKSTTVVEVYKDQGLLDTFSADTKEGVLEYLLVYLKTYKVRVMSTSHEDVPDDVQSFNIDDIIHS